MARVMNVKDGMVSLAGVKIPARVNLTLHSIPAPKPLFSTYKA